MPSIKPLFQRALWLTESPRWLLYALLFSLSLTGTAGWISSVLARRDARSRAGEQLSIVVDLKLREIQSWLEFQKLMAAGIVADPEMAERIARWNGSTIVPAEERTRWLTALAAIQRVSKYRNVTLLAPDATLMLSTVGAPNVSSLHDREAVESAIRARGPVVTTVHRHSGLPGQALSIDVVAPIGITEASDWRCVAVLMLEIAPDEALLPWIQKLPFPSETAEVLLAERQDERVIFLNELRHRQGTALTLSVPLTAKRYLAAQLALGNKGFLEGVDYRDVPVLGAGRIVPGNNWLLVAKIDVSEVNRHIWQSVLMTGIMTFVCALAGLVLIRAWLQHRSAAIARVSEARYRGLFESMNDAVFIVGQSGKFVEVNQAACERLGYRREELLALGPGDINPRGSATWAIGPKGLGMRGAQDPVETVHVRKDGGRIPVEIQSRKLEFDGHPVVLSSARDITERKRAESVIFSGQARFRAVFENAGVAIAMTDAEGCFVELNPKWIDLLGYQREELLGRPHIEVTVPDEAASLELHFKALSAGRLSQYMRETRYLRKDGSIVWGLLSVTPICNYQGDTENLIGIVTDITERKRMEAELMLVSERLSIATKGAGIGIWDWDIAKNRLIWDAEMCRLYGIRMRDFSGQFSSFRDALVLTDRQRTMDAIDDSLRYDRELEIEHRIRRPNGIVRHIRTVAKNVRDEEGKPTRMVGMCFDVTARKDAEDALQQNMLRLQTIISNIHGGVVIFSRNGLVEMVNLQFCEIFCLNAKPEQLIGLTPTDLFPKLAPCVADPAEFLVRAAEISEAGIAQHGEELRLLNGKVVLRDFLPVVMEGEIVATVWTHRDISKIKEAEQKLLENERFLTTVADSMPGMVGYWTVDLHCAFANCKYLEWFGRKPEEMIGVPMRTLLGEEMFQQNEPFVRGVLAGEIQSFERTLTKADGSTGYTWAHYIPDWAGGAVQGFFVMITDITELKLAQLQLEALNSDLALRTQQAEAANSAKGEFLANMSHEIRTPMNAVVGLSQLLQKTELSPKQQEYLERIQSASRSLLGIINDVLDLSKIDANKLQLEHTDFDLRKVMQRVEGIIAQRAGEKGLTVQFELPKHLPHRLVGDPLRLGQILLNLAANAVKFTESGSISVSAELITQTLNEARVRFIVQDTGIGIPKEVLGRLFRSFSQADSSTTRRFGGTGLGLAISKRLVDLMGGEIGVSSEPSKGATFYFTVTFELSDKSTDELAEQEPNAANSPDEEPSPLSIRYRPNASRPRILLVEDNETNQMVASEFLEQADADVTIASNGRQAVDMVLRGGERFDLILMDVQMPEMDGLEATRLIRQVHKSLPIVAMTAHVMASERIRCLDAGMNDHIPKPFERTELVSAVQRWIHRGRPSKEPEAAGRDAPPASSAFGDVVSMLLDKLDQDRTKVDRVLAMLNRDLEVGLGLLTDGLRLGDAAAVGRAAHKVKGAASVVPITAIVVAARTVEQAAKAGEEWGALAHQLSRVLSDFLKTDLSGGGSVEPISEPPIDVNREQLGGLLGELSVMLRRRSLAARRGIVSLRELVGAHPTVLEIERCIELMDFAGASAGVAQLASRFDVPIPSGPMSTSLARPSTPREPS